jgi:cytochrome c oxidase cbb3-type subunit III
MDEINDKELQNHEYDGIKEYDNPLPNWWLTTFFGTIIFAFIYFLHYEFGGGQTQEQELAVALAQIEMMKSSQPALAATEADLDSMIKDPAVIQSGAKIFANNCVACHGAELQGMIGPNLVDNYWIHGKGTSQDLINMVKKGVLDKGMPAWEAVLRPNEVVAVSAYVLSKKGTQPANAKAPQGELVQ